MAFGISCSLTTKRKNKIEDEDTRATLRASKGGPHGPVDIVGSSKTRYAGQRHLPTLLTCGLSDPLFFGEPKWPRQKKKRFAATGPVGGFDSELEDGLPAVCLTRPTRFGYSRQSREAYAKSREADLLLKAKMRSLKFPVLDMLHPTSVDKSGLPPNFEETYAPRKHVPRHDNRRVVLPKTVRTNMIVDAAGRRIFTDLPLCHNTVPGHTL